MSRMLKNERPVISRTKRAALRAARTKEQRRKLSYSGAQYSPTLTKWIGYVWDGRDLTMLEPRADREVAMRQARQHLDRIFTTESAERLEA